MPRERKTCTRCSMRRQRCDRNAPCQRCVRAGVGDACSREWTGGYSADVHRRYPKTQTTALKAITTPEAPPMIESHARLLRLLTQIHRILPPRQSVFQLVDYHGHSLQWYHGSISSRKFRRELDAVQHSSDSLELQGLDLQWCALLFATMAASLIASPDDVLREWGFSKQRKLVLAQAWYQAAFHCLKQASQIQRPGMCTVQAIQVLFMSAKQLGYSKQQFELFNVAQQTATGLGFREASYESTLDFLTLATPERNDLPDVGRMIWTQLCLQEWLAVRAVDTLTTNALLRTEGLLHCLIMRGSAVAANPSDSGNSDIAPLTDFCLYLDRIAKVAAGHFDTHSQQPMSYLQVLDLDQKLRTISQDPLYATSEPARIVLSHLFILIHRRYLLESFKDSCYAYSRWASILASTEIIKDIDSARDEKGETLLWEFLSTVFAALVTLGRCTASISIASTEYYELRCSIDRAVAILQGSCYGELAAEVLMRTQGRSTMQM